MGGRYYNEYPEFSVGRRILGLGVAGLKWRVRRRTRPTGLHGFETRTKVGPPWPPMNGFLALRACLGDRWQAEGLKMSRPYGWIPDQGPPMNGFLALRALRNRANPRQAVGRPGTGTDKERRDARLRGHDSLGEILELPAGFGPGSFFCCFGEIGLDRSWPVAINSGFL